MASPFGVTGMRRTAVPIRIRFALGSYSDSVTPTMCSFGMRMAKATATRGGALGITTPSALRFWSPQTARRWSSKTGIPTAPGLR